MEAAAFKVNYDNPSCDDPDALLATIPAANLLGLHPGTLEQMRIKGEGPKYVKLGRRVLYRKCDLEDYVATCVVDPCLAGAGGK